MLALVCRQRCVKDVTMIYAGVFFFFVTIASGLCGFNGVVPLLPAGVAQTVFFCSLLLATVTFTLRLVRNDVAPFELVTDAPNDARTERVQVLVPAGVALETSLSPQL
jgi:uncharacterized membrane protein YtjA (UPF0391 family)